MNELDRAKTLILGRKIINLGMGERSTGGGVMIELDNGTVLTAGRRNPHDEEGAVNGYPALRILLEDVAMVDLGAEIMSTTYQAAAKVVAEKVAEYCYTGTDAGDIYNQLDGGESIDSVGPDEAAFLRQFQDEDYNILKECLAEEIAKVRKALV